MSPGPEFFCPATCHGSPISRRQLLAGSAALLATVVGRPGSAAPAMTARRSFVSTRRCRTIRGPCAMASGPWVATSR